MQQEYCIVEDDDSSDFHSDVSMSMIRDEGETEKIDTKANSSSSPSTETIKKLSPFSCPMYIQIFYKLDGHNDLDSFTTTNSHQSSLLSTSSHLHANATITTLLDYIKLVCEQSRGPRIKFSINLVYRDYRGKFCSKHVWDNLGGNRRKDVPTFKSIRFKQGDYFDIAILNLNTNK